MCVPGQHTHSSDPTLCSGSFSEPLWAKEASKKSVKAVQVCGAQPHSQLWWLVCGVQPHAQLWWLLCGTLCMYGGSLSESGGPFIDQVYVLQGYAEGWKEGTWEEKVDARPCIDPLLYSQDKHEYYR